MGTGLVIPFSYGPDGTLAEVTGGLGAACATQATLRAVA